MLRDCNQGDGELFLSLSALANDGLRIDHYKYLLAHLRTRYSAAVRSSEKENIKKCISSLLYLVITQFSPKDRAATTSLIKELYGAEQTITNLFVYGRFHAFDFSALTISESSFVNFSEFHKCGFPEEDRSVFLYTEFKNFDIPKSNKIRQAFFDSSCSFSHCNINEIVGESEKEYQSRVNSITKDVSVLAGYIDTSIKSVNLIKRYCSISYPKGEKRLLDDLIKIGFIERERIKGDLLYKIAPAYFDELPAIKLGRLPLELSSQIEQLVS